MTQLLLEKFPCIEREQEKARLRKIIEDLCEAKITGIVANIKKYCSKALLTFIIFLCGMLSGGANVSDRTSLSDRLRGGQYEFRKYTAVCREQQQAEQTALLL